ncbi:MAG: sugar transferase [Halomonas sp.]|jgi:lipopolysaccharide/colanic/teichoic acid biosynthesis glycosyltransferase|uniref:Sugar transferase n=1 Tax=Billgrantia tianxiuensis TaxID=2497861 RepID=A0A6I6SIP2_9GAMM|nr:MULTISPECIES: sugar transferase [Halomonas]MCE8034689.1 sugar transferase [Halomonas sp. MCCC 1A11057]MDX5433435.1 sugar transferase [Halomonas sp.]QHC50548.1 sugar transferase [Halomonas tianxiuensis]
MNAAIKRSIDIAVSASALLVLAPLLALIALLIRCDSPGPALFIQRRVGRNLAPFRIYKFRTMQQRDAAAIDPLAEGVIRSGQDPRITRMGRYLRATSLDELPQLFNILKGDMSLVGPRPVLIEQVEAVPDEYMKRFTVRPGLTGLAQVQGRRSLGWLEQLALDVRYTERASVGFDLWLMLATAYVVLTFKDIYGSTERNWRQYRKSRRQHDVGEAK